MRSDIVETRGLTERHGNGVLAVDRLDPQVRHGEVGGFLCPNGSGKTTTIRMLLGLIRPTSGTATVADAPAGSPRKPRTPECVTSRKGPASIGPFGPARWHQPAPTLATT
jgi:ABC-type multidrug transport system ATPase subunit